MLGKNVTNEQLWKAARLTGVELYYTPYEAEGGLRFRLKPMNDGRKRPYERFPYWRTSTSYFRRGRTVCAVCWHGHRDYFRNLFRVEPKAKVLTAFTRRIGVRYYTADNFEYTFPKTDINIGPPIAPVYASEACHCHETSAAMIPQAAMTGECWLVQMQGLRACDTCEARDTEDCGGSAIRRTGQNEKGYVVPLRVGSANLFGPRKEEA